MAYAEIESDLVSPLVIIFIALRRLWEGTLFSSFIIVYAEGGGQGGMCAMVHIQRLEDKFWKSGLFFYFWSLESNSDYQIHISKWFYPLSHQGYFSFRTIII